MRKSRPCKGTHLSKPKFELIAHNAAFELAWFGAKLKVQPAHWFDTFLAAKLLSNGDARHNDLGSVLDSYLGLRLDKSLGVSDWGAWFLVDPQIQYAHNSGMVESALSWQWCATHYP
jgi:ribonuclease D